MWLLHIGINGKQSGLSVFKRDYGIIYKGQRLSRGRKGSTGVARLRWHVVAPSPRKKVETNTKANNELALAA